MSEDRDLAQQPENPTAHESESSSAPAPEFPPASPPVVPTGRAGEWFPVHVGYAIPGLRPAPMLPPPPPPPAKSRVGLVITGLISLVGVAGLVLGVITYNDGTSGSANGFGSGSGADGKVTQDAMCQTIAVASVGNGPSAIPTMPGGQEDLTAMRAAEVQVYQWAVKTESGPLKTELEQENSDAEQFISDYTANPEQDSITPTGVLSIDMSTFTIDQTKVDSTCGIAVTGPGGLSA